MSDELLARRESQLAHPQTRYTELGKGHWVTFKVHYAKFGGRGTSSVRSFRNQDDAEEFADKLQSGSRPRIEKIETTVLRWEDDAQ